MVKKINELWYGHRIFCQKVYISHPLILIGSIVTNKKYIYIYIHYIHNIGIGSILNLLCKLFFWLLITANNLLFKIYYKSKTFKIYYKSESFVKIRE